MKRKLICAVCVLSSAGMISFGGCASNKVETQSVTESEIAGSEAVSAESEISETETASDEVKSSEQTADAETDKIDEGAGLAALYADNFPIGVALPNQVLKKTSFYEEKILHNFNSITCENEMKPDSLLDKAKCQENIDKTYTEPAIHFDNCKPAIEFALEHNMKIRFHTLVWHSQTPAWFFTQDYTDDGELVSREVMLQRMESYIKSVLTYFNEEYPGLIYAVDVCNEAFDEGNGDENGVRRKDNLWYDTVGDDYYYQAFVFARKYASEDMKLFYNDYACMWKTDLILNHLQKAKDEGLIDGIGMQSHLSVSDEIVRKFIPAAKKFCDAGYELQITELDIGTDTATEKDLMLQARKYKVFFENIKKMQEDGYNITGITVWGLSDNLSWRRGEHALLFDDIMKPKPAFAGAMLSEDIPSIE